MGQQQLLLIVLGVVVVGIAIVVGITAFSKNAAQTNLDNIVSELVQMGSQVQSYYRRPRMQGGGGYSFVGYQFPDEGLTHVDVVGKFDITSATDTMLVIKGTGVEDINHDGVVDANDAMVVTVRPAGSLTPEPLIVAP